MIIGPALQAVPDVDQQRAWHRRRVDPSARCVADLQPACTLRQDREALVVRVCTDSDAGGVNRPGRLRRIVDQPQLGHRLADLVVKPMLIEAQRERKATE